jgi:hypothetical protein
MSTDPEVYKNRKSFLIGTIIIYILTILFYKFKDNSLFRQYTAFKFIRN